jgi:hypothetical protein
MGQESSSAESTTTFAELARPVPRNVRMTGTGWANVVLLMVIFGAAAAFLVYESNTAFHIYSNRDTLRTGASDTTAQITREWTSGKRSSTQHIGYAFQVGGTTYSGEAIVPKTIWENLKNAGVVNIKYSPSDPRINYPADWEDSLARAFSPLIFVAMLLLFGAVLLRLLRTQYRLVAEGLPALARVTERIKGGRGGYFLKYEFRTETGEIVKDSCAEEETQEVGSTISVIYLPSNPRTSKLYPIETFKVDG